MITTDQRRRRWSVGEKATLVRRTYEPGMTVSVVARQAGVSASLLFLWRKLERQGALMAVSAGKAVVPASEPSRRARGDQEAAAHRGQEDPGERDLERGGGVVRRKKVDCALTLAAQGRRPMKAMCVMDARLAMPAKTTQVRPME